MYPKFQNKKLLFFFSIFTFPLSAEKSAVTIKQVNKDRIQKYARHIRGVMNRRSIMTKAGIAGISAYALYTIGSWVRTRSNDPVQNETELDNLAEPTNQQLLQNQNTLQAQVTTLRTQIRQLQGLNNINKTGWQKAWDTFKNTGRSLFQWIGLPILLTNISSRFNHFMGFTQSIDIFDQNVTHCMEVLQYLVYNIQEIAEFMNRSGKQIPIDKEDFARTINRLVNSLEKMIGFIHAKKNTFTDKQLKDETDVLAERLTEYAQEFAEDLQDELKTDTTDLRQIAQIIARFGQRYAQEKQRFALIEQEG